jgi:hypothetical protein
MREREVEKALVDAVKAAGGIAYKFVSPGNAGVPDRLVVLPEGKIGFVELKAPGKRSRPVQQMQKHRLERLGFLVMTVDRPDYMSELVRVIQTHKGGDARHGI